MSETTGFTARMMQRALCEEMENLFADEKYSGQESRKHLRLFQQKIPIPTDDDEDTDTNESFPPYILVMLDGGTIPNKDSPQIVSTTLVICCYDTETEREGYQDVINITERIIQHFSAKPFFGGAFTVLCETGKEITWAIQEDDTAPYYYGAVNLFISTPAASGDATWETLV